MPLLDDWQRPSPTHRQRRIDLAIGLGVTAAALLNVLLSRGAGVFVFGVERGLAEQLAWAFAVSVPLVWRRSYPIAVMVVTTVVFLAGQVRGAQEAQFASGALFATIYAAGAWGRDRGRARWTRLTVIGSMFVWLAVSWLLANDAGGQPPPRATGELPWLLSTIVSSVLINVVIFGFAYLFGETAWLAARRQDALEAQAAELRVARGLAEERAVLGERVRIARELHDVVAHHVSVMGIQAAAARRALDRDSAKSRTALTAVEDSARTAVDELRRMLGALRATEVGAPAPAAGVDRIESLADPARAAGLTVEFAVFGAPVPLPESTSQTAYRIAQEAVTNTLKHASASTVDIRLRYLARELELDIVDDGRGAVASAPTGGLGLLGMRERVWLHGGTLETTPRPTGGFRLRARLPLPGENRPSEEHA